MTTGVKTSAVSKEPGRPIEGQDLVANDVTMITLTAGELAHVMGGNLSRGTAATSVERFSIDTRTLEPGQTFIALRGERFDGHTFVPDAFARGALGVIVSDAPSVNGRVAGPRGAFVIQVADTTAALQELARFVRRMSAARVVAITGSAGKTTTKEATARFLAGRYRVFRNRGNLNNHIGLPLSLLELRYEPEIAVVELGMNHAGEISRLVSVAEPEVRVWTNVAEVHLEFFDSLAAVADAKAEILEQADVSSVLVANADDPLVMERAQRFPGRVLTFGIDTEATVMASHVRDHGLDGMEATLRSHEGTRLLQTPLIGRSNLSNVLAAAAVALHFDVSIDEVVARARTLEAAAHRGEVVRLRDGLTVLDDSYNSNPLALRKLLGVVRNETTHRRRVLVLGEMLELGAHSKRLHAECGRDVALTGVAELIVVGGEPAKALMEGAVTAGLEVGRVRHLSTSAEAGDVVTALVQPGDLVVVKGSRGIGLDRVVERLKVEYT